jgi:ElaB/YqjD/DUF883 family membrane-anchored ribosome-binding protein
MGCYPPVSTNLRVTPHGGIKEFAVLLSFKIMKNNTDTITEKPNEIIADLNALVAEAKKIIGRNIKTESDTISTLRTQFNDSKEHLTDLYSDGKKNVVAGAKYTHEKIRAYPYQSLAIATGVGLLVGMVVGRRSGKE